MQKEIKHQFFYAHPPAIVWEYLTTSELIAQWLMANDFKPVVGHEFKFTTQAMPNFNFDGNVFCEVLEIVPMQKLSYSWKGGPGPGVITLDSVVVWTLKAKDNGTELLLEHTGFKETDVPMYMIMNEGWQKIMNKMNELMTVAK